MCTLEIQCVKQYEEDYIFSYMKETRLQIAPLRYVSVVLLVDPLLKIAKSIKHSLFIEVVSQFTSLFIASVRKTPFANLYNTLAASAASHAA